MRYRVMRLENGTEIKESPFMTFILHTDGTVGEVVGDLEYEVTEPHIVEFSFEKDDQGEDIWSHCVIHD